MKRALLVVGLPVCGLLLLSCSCVSLAPEARDVRVTREASDVAGCRMIGTVATRPPYWSPNDGWNQLKNEAAGRGGNVVFVTSDHWTKGKTGMAYRCESKLADLR